MICAQHVNRTKILTRFLTMLLMAPFLFSCNQPSNKVNLDEDNNYKVRDIPIAFMGIQVGAPNGSETAMIDSMGQVMRTTLPDGINHYLGSSNRSLFANPEEKTINTFFASIIDKQDDKHNGWGLVKSDCDSITTVHFIIPNCETEVVYERILELFVERYGEPDSSYVEGEDEEMKNTLCYWNFSNSRRITLNKCQFYGSTISNEWERLFKIYERVEIAYQDMKSVSRHEAAEKAKAEEEERQRMQDEEDRKSENRKVRARQQL